MTNKIPVVGRRYKLRNQFGKGNGEIVMVVSVDKDFSCKLYLEKRGGVCSDPLPLASFCNICEELPEDSLQETEEEPTTKKNLQVERALEELKYSLARKDNHEFKGHVFFHGYKKHWKPLLDLLNAIKYAAQNLVDALEAEKTVMAISGSSFDMKEERVDPRSIWKDNDDLKELDKRNEQFLVRLKDGRVIMPILSNILTDDKQSNKNIKEATTLTDFINFCQQTQKDIEELKQKLGNV
jgi:hypothetical protein